ncbi:MAG TPA: 2,3-bisphosphoglycerate-independent phosphoglycerate mutase [Candidatus Binatia bacterium]|nr:2,3-bisphosphoglycerate-independent phosphoglycerate mutase [Candidatus Binatia bacterium]
MADITEIWERLARPNGGKIVYLVLDGLGGLPDPTHGRSELQIANTPNLDRLARSSSCGMLEMVGPGITPGSGPGHLSLFGYDPLTYPVGRGVLAALGIGFDLKPGDVAARVNFATIDSAGKISDRRAGRITTKTNRSLCERIRDEVKLECDGEFFFETVRDYRAVLILRGDRISGEVDDTDPQKTGVFPAEPQSKIREGARTVQIVRSLVDQARKILSQEEKANMILLRGFSRYTPIRSLEERFRLKSICLADYPMYRGLSRLLGMELASLPASLENAFEPLHRAYGEDFDFYFLHVKQTDSAGEDGAFARKVSAIEQVDALLPRISELDADVMVITGDHSTPSIMASHSWHPVPVLLCSKFSRNQPVERFDEDNCMRGALGLRPALDLMGLALAHAGRLQKYGA